MRTRSIWCETAWLPDGWHDSVQIDIDPTGTIAAVSVVAYPADAERLMGAVVPGMPNIHSHAFQRAAAGLTERRSIEGGGNTADSFWTWRAIMHDFVTRLTPDDHEAIAAQLYVEMLKAGYTAVGEFHYLHRDPAGRDYSDPAEMSGRIISAAERTGIGVTLLPVLYSVGGYGNVVLNDGQRRYMLGVEEFLDLVSGLIGAYGNLPQVGIGIAPHSVRQVPAEPLVEVLAAFTAMAPNAPIHIHVAEQIKDVREHVHYTGARPVAWLLDNAAVDQRWCLVHATHIDQGETRALARTGAVAGLCPTTEGNLGDGLFPFAAYLAAGGAWGVGSDSHVSVSPTEELRWLEYGQRLISRTRNIAAPTTGGGTGARLYTDALAGGARALCRSVGALAQGHRADLLVLDADHPTLAGRVGETMIDSLVFSGNVTPIRHVMCGGAWVVRDGHHPDEEVIADAYRASVSRLTATAL